MAKVKKAEFYGASGGSGSTTFREKLASRFKATDFVRVINIDDEPFRWQYMPTAKEHITVLPDYTDDVQRENPEVYELAPGESQVLLGENAFLMIEALYKQLTAKKVVAGSTVEPGQARNFNFSDDLRQEEFINDIYMGKETPRFDSPEVKHDAAPSRLK
jgi:hypothetical protein